jgi:hypothetical protein
VVTQYLALCDTDAWDWIAEFLEGHNYYSIYAVDYNNTAEDGHAALRSISD